MKSWARWLIVALATLEAGWMIFDGARALVVGDYVTPQSEEYAGQLGPWAALVAAIGIDPRSTAMKLAFVVYGVAWLVVVGAYAMQRPWARTGMIAAAAGSLWYLVVGSIVSALQLALLLVPRLRAREGAG